jgi:hypothetical protein
MVRGLAVCALRLALAAWLLGGAFVITAHALPPSALARALHLHLCALPCWLQITPGQTSMDSAYAHLTTYYAIDAPSARADNSFTTQVHDLMQLPIPGLTEPRSGLPLTIEFEHARTSSVQLFFGQQYPLTVGDVLAAVGAPACVEPHSRTLLNGWTLYYQADDLTFARVNVSADRAQEQVMHPRLRVFSIALSRALPLHTSTCAPSARGRFPWAAMAPRWAYGTPD